MVEHDVCHADRQDRERKVTRDHGDEEPGHEDLGGEEGQREERHAADAGPQHRDVACVARHLEDPCHHRHDARRPAGEPDTEEPGDRIDPEACSPDEDEQPEETHADPRGEPQTVRDEVALLELPRERTLQALDGAA